MSYPIDKLLNLIRQQAMGVQSLFTHLRVGIVSEYDVNTYTAQVLIQPENMLSGWLPISTAWSGNGWGLYTPPTQGDLVQLHFMEGSLSVGFVGDRLFTNYDVPIAGCPSGEAWMVHKTGSFFKFKNDGTVELTCLDSNGNPTNFNINANIVQTGNFTTTGNVLDNSNTNAHTVKDMRTIYNSHTHGGIIVGSDNTLDPNQSQ